MLGLYLVFVCCLTVLATVVVTGSVGSRFYTSAEFARGLTKTFTADGFAARAATEAMDAGDGAPVPPRVREKSSASCASSWPDQA